MEKIVSVLNLRDTAKNTFRQLDGTFEAISKSWHFSPQKKDELKEFFQKDKTLFTITYSLVLNKINTPKLQNFFLVFFNLI
jgi:hypothetical protein